MSLFARTAKPGDEGDVTRAEVPPTEPPPRPAPVVPTMPTVLAGPATPDVEELRAENRTLRLTLDVRQVAGARLADPDDLLRYVDPDTLVDSNGNPDHNRISLAVEELLARKGYLAAPTPSVGSADGGARWGPSAPPVTREELSVMEPRHVARLAERGLLTHLGIGGQ